MQKMILLSAVLFGLMTFSFPGFTKEEAKEHNFALLISQPRHVGGVLAMLKRMKADKNLLQYKNARIVLYGDAIHTAKKGSELTEAIAEAKKNNVTVAVCNQAMKRLEVSPKELLNTVEVVENAYYEMLRLKTLGYISLDL